MATTAPVPTTPKPVREWQRYLELIKPTLPGQQVI